MSLKANTSYIMNSNYVKKKKETFENKEYISDDSEKQSAYF